MIPLFVHITFLTLRDERHFGANFEERILSTNLTQFKRDPKWHDIQPSPSVSLFLGSFIQQRPTDITAHVEHQVPSFNQSHA